MVEILQNYLLKVYSLVTSKTAKHTGIVFLGGLISAIISFLSITIISRALGPKEFGIFSTATALMATIAGFTDFGLGTGLVKFVPKYLKSDRKKVKTLMNVVLKIEILLGVAVLGIGLLLVNPLARLLSQSNPEQLVVPLRLAIIGAMGMSLSAFVPAAFQAYERFFLLGSFSIITNSLKILLLILLLIFGHLTGVNSMWIYALVPILGFFLGLLLVNKDYLYTGYSSEEQKGVFYDLFHFSKWVMLSFFATSLIGKLDIFMISHFKNSKEVGIYSAAFQLATVFPIFIGALTSVVFPKVSGMTNEGDVGRFFKKTLLLSFVVIIFISPLFFLSRWLIPLIFGHLFVNALLPFQVLLLSFSISIVMNPLSTILYRFDRASLITVTNYIQLAFVFVLNLILVPKFGGLGAAFSFFLMTLLGGILVLSFIFLEFRHRSIRIL